MDKGLFLKASQAFKQLDEVQTKIAQIRNASFYCSNTCKVQIGEGSLQYTITLSKQEIASFVNTVLASLEQQEQKLIEQINAM
jgi:hypothetical protein